MSEQQGVGGLVDEVDEVEAMRRELAWASGVLEELPRLPVGERKLVREQVRDRLRELAEGAAPAGVVNACESDAAAARRFAGEIVRLSSGLADLGVPLVDGPIDTVPVTTALAELRRLQERVEASPYLQVVEAEARRVAEVSATPVHLLVPDLAGPVAESAEGEGDARTGVRLVFSVQFAGCAMIPAEMIDDGATGPQQVFLAGSDEPLRVVVYADAGHYESTVIPLGAAIELPTIDDADLRDGLVALEFRDYVAPCGQNPCEHAPHGVSHPVVGDGSPQAACPKVTDVASDA